MGMGDSGPALKPMKKIVRMSDEYPRQGFRPYYRYGVPFKGMSIQYIAGYVCLSCHASVSHEKTGEHKCPMK
jgi:hypothetical protein